MFNHQLKRNFLFQSFSDQLCCMVTEVLVMFQTSKNLGKLFLFSFLIFLLIFGLCRLAGGILIPGPEMEPMPSAVEVRILNQWTTRAAPRLALQWSSVVQWTFRVVCSHPFLVSLTCSSDDQSSQIVNPIHIIMRASLVAKW